jgi:hypothetical protein
MYFYPVLSGVFLFVRDRHGDNAKVKGENSELRVRLGRFGVAWWVEKVFSALRVDTSSARRQKHGTVRN